MIDCSATPVKRKIVKDSGPERGCPSQVSLNESVTGSRAYAIFRIYTIRNRARLRFRTVSGVQTPSCVKWKVENKLD
jgi:hypothetical protein